MEDKIICSACGEELDRDDAVYCPICGAPHHRECYIAKGECALFDKHGTEEQYKKEVKEEAIPEQFTPKGEEAEENDIPPHILGGYKDKDDIGGVTAGDAGRFVSFNPARYVSLFAKMALAGKKASFNLLAFLLPEGWFFLRKNYIAGVLVSVALAIAKILCYPAALFFSSLGSAETTIEYYSVIMQNIGQLPKSAFILMAVAGVINIGIRLFSGIFGDLIYKNAAFAAIKQYRIENPKADGRELMLKGGINPFASIIGFAITGILPTIILSFI